MKLKLWITAAVMLVGWSATAQIERKRVLLGGNVSFSTSSENSNSFQPNSLAIGPRVGYFVGNHLAVGMEFNYNLSKLDGEWYDYFDEETGNVERGFGFREENFGLSPFIRKYLPVKRNFSAFAQGALTFQFNSYKNIDDTGYLYRTDYNFKGFGSSLNLGFAYFPKSNWGIEFSFPFIKYFNERNVGSAYHLKDPKDFQTVADNFIPNIGINFHL
jgi:hypothetical protein